MHIFEHLVVHCWRRRISKQRRRGFASCLPSLSSRAALELLMLMHSYDMAAQSNGTFVRPSNALKRSFRAMLIWSAFRVARENPAVFVFGVLGLLPAIVMVLIHLGRRFAELVGLL